MTTSLWELTEVSLGRRQHRLVEVTLSIGTGRTAVIGPSGAGKTSLLNLLVGFERPDAGRIVPSIGASDGRLPLAWVPPDFGLWPHLTVRQHIETVSPTTDTDRTDSLLSALHLLELADAAPDRLSQGERSRLAVARALASQPGALVLDEPLVHVDPAHLDRYWQMIEEQCRTDGASLVFSSHSPAQVLRHAERVVCLDEGRVVFSGRTRDLYHHPPSARLAWFLGPGNWFEGEDAKHWISKTKEPYREETRNLTDPSNVTERSNGGFPPGADPRKETQGVCLRPEEVDLVPQADSSFIIELTTSAGAVIESVVRDEVRQELRTVYHRASSNGPDRGDRVVLRLCAILLLCLAWAGCRDSAAGPTIDVRSSRTIKMTADGTKLPAPRSLTVSPDGELYVLDNAGRVLVYDASGSLNRQWRMPESEIGHPEAVCIMSDGTVAIADTHYARVVLFDRNGTVVRMFGEQGEQPGQFIFPVGITTDSANRLYVAEYGGNDRIQKFTAQGEFLDEFGSFGLEDGQFQRPSGLVWHDGTLYVADAINNRIQAFSDSGEFLGVLSGTEDVPVPLHYPYDITMDAEGSLFVVEYGAGRITQLATDGRLLGRYGTAGRDEAQFWTPWGLTVDNRGHVFVADTGNRRIVELTL